MTSCRRKTEHKCRAEGTHIEGDCECTYGMDIEYDHTFYHIDPRCRDLESANTNKMYENNRKGMVRLPKWMRDDKTPNVHDELRDACWNLTDDQICDIVRCIRKTYGDG